MEEVFEILGAVALFELLSKEPKGCLGALAIVIAIAIPVGIVSSRDTHNKEVLTEACYHALEVKEDVPGEHRGVPFLVEFTQGETHDVAHVEWKNYTIMRKKKSLSRSAGKWAKEKATDFMKGWRDEK